MGEQTGISWCHHTHNAWEGCEKISPACKNCYAEAMNRWLRGGENWGPGSTRRLFSDEHWARPLRWNKAAIKAGERRRVFARRLVPLQAMVRRSPTRRRRPCRRKDPPPDSGRPAMGRVPEEHTTMTDLVYGLVFAAMSNAGDDDGAMALQCCTSASCIYLARWTCHWPGQTSVKCDHCRGRLATIAEAMGFTLQATALDVRLSADPTSARAALLELD